MTEPSPVFLIDRSLGRHRVPDGLRRAGWHVVTLAEHYGEPHAQAVPDEAWLRLAGEQGWAVLMKDDRIRYRESERRALAVAGVNAFCLASGNLRAEEMITMFLRHAGAIQAACAVAGPSLHVLSRTGMRQIDLT
jgi:hypothetical protein